MSATANIAQYNALLDMVHALKSNALSVSDLPKNMQELIATLSVAWAGMQQCSKQATARAYDIQELMHAFIDSYNSEQTQKSYRNQLFKHFLPWCENRGISPLLITAKDARSFASDIQRIHAHSPSKANMIIAVTSSFYTHLASIEIVDKSPFMRIKRLPKKTKSKLVPSSDEVETIITHLKKNRKESIAHAVQLMSQRGFRIGALADMTIRNGYFSANTKGKELTGKLLGSVANYRRNPIQGIKLNTLQSSLRREIKKLYQSGQIQELYSAHSFRHYFAVQIYKSSNYDIEKVRRLLGHNNITTTSIYLGSLGYDV